MTPSKRLCKFKALILQAGFSLGLAIGNAVSIHLEVRYKLQGLVKPNVANVLALYTAEFQKKIVLRFRLFT